MSVSEQFHRFASRNFNRSCVFSSLLQDNKAHCPHAVCHQKRVNLSPEHAPDRSYHASSSVEFADRHDQKSCEYHCKSSTHQMACVIAVDTAHTLCRFTLKQPFADKGAAQRAIDANERHTTMADKTFEARQRDSLSSGLVNAMRETVLPHLHRRLPVNNLSKLVEQTFGPNPQSPDHVLSQRIVRCVAKTVAR